MAIEHILTQIDSEIARLTQARKILASIGNTTTTTPRKGAKAAAKARSGKKRFLSAEARKRIADAQRRRWAAVHAKAKKKA
jgi:hypothetical protein